MQMVSSFEKADILTTRNMVFGNFTPINQIKRVELYTGTTIQFIIKLEIRIGSNG